MNSYLLVYFWTGTHLVLKGKIGLGYYSLISKESINKKIKTTKIIEIVPFYTNEIIFKILI